MPRLTERVTQCSICLNKRRISSHRGRWWLQTVRTLIRWTTKSETCCRDESIPCQDTQRRFDHFKQRLNCRRAASLPRQNHQASCSTAYVSSWKRCSFSSTRNLLMKTFPILETSSILWYKCVNDLRLHLRSYARKTSEIRIMYTSIKMQLFRWKW